MLKTGRTASACARAVPLTDAWRGADLPAYDGVLAGVPARLTGAAALPLLVQRLDGWLALLSAMLGCEAVAGMFERHHRAVLC